MQHILKEFPRGENKLLGSCPNCGTGIWSYDLHNPEGTVYRCVGCKQFVEGKDIIPF